MNRRVEGIGSHQSTRSKTDVWLTPPYIIEEMGGASSFDLDPCAPINRPFETARTYFTEEDNGLTKEWNGRVWLNPPYSQPVIQSWMARMAGHGNGVALIFARTETIAFHKYVWDACDALFFIEGRLNFHLPDGREASANAGAPSVLCAYGDENADCLAGCTLDGAFVPLRLRAFVQGLSQPGTWLEEITKIMASAMSSMKLADLYRELAGSPKAKRNPNYKAKIRQVLQQGPFEPVARGEWRLI